VCNACGCMLSSAVDCERHSRRSYEDLNLDQLCLLYRDFSENQLMRLSVEEIKYFTSLRYM
jgi:hypothetical protein